MKTQTKNNIIEVTWSEADAESVEDVVVDDAKPNRLAPETIARQAELRARRERQKQRQQEKIDAARERLAAAPPKEVVFDGTLSQPGKMSRCFDVELDGFSIKQMCSPNFWARCLELEVRDHIRVWSSNDTKIVT